MSSHRKRSGSRTVCRYMTVSSNSVFERLPVKFAAQFCDQKVHNLVRFVVQRFVFQRSFENPINCHNGLHFKRPDVVSARAQTLSKMVFPSGLNISRILKNKIRLHSGLKKSISTPDERDRTSRKTYYAPGQLSGKSGRGPR